MIRGSVNNVVGNKHMVLLVVEGILIGTLPCVVRNQEPGNRVADKKFPVDKTPVALYPVMVYGTPAGLT